MNMLAEFKDFAMRGNVVDMAVGIIKCISTIDIRASRCPHCTSEIG